MFYVKRLFLLFACVCAIPGCTVKHTPRNIDGIASISSAYVVIGDTYAHRKLAVLLDAQETTNALKAESVFRKNQYGTFRTKESGGAIILSPRHILLSDHQLLWPSDFDLTNIYLDNNSIGPFGPLKATVIEHKADSLTLDPSTRKTQDGWILLELEEPVVEFQAIPFASDPAAYKGKTCYIPISKSVFLSHNESLPQNGYSTSENGDIIFIPGTILRKRPRWSLSPSPEYFQGNKLVIRISESIDPRGASGFPVLVYDDDAEQWIAVGVNVSGILEPENNRTWIFAMYPTQEQLEAVD